MVALATGTRSVTICSQLPSSRWLWCRNKDSNKTALIQSLLSVCYQFRLRLANTCNLLFPVLRHTCSSGSCFILSVLVSSVGHLVLLPGLISHDFPQLCSPPVASSLVIPCVFSVFPPCCLCLPCCLSPCSTVMCLVLAPVQLQFSCIYDFLSFPKETTFKFSFDQEVLHSAAHSCLPHSYPQQHLHADFFIGVSSWSACSIP